ncbi:hypothetical protein BK816_02270 [Boudabousia tangfeifanii]|uniref:exo-alpha-sialidase n=1 Tax=Boudabousia tangfeifanii TaxID=1912795 RepID=A0A1D9MJB0_9ACTO|nr:S-layer homology domain-containing protein [Boudabousia tangfeifanii]AOZ72269.1 hypothetical protein BK816_02270 [Boudabousia tangfeifanii]
MSATHRSRRVIAAATLGLGSLMLSMVPAVVPNVAQAAEDKITYQLIRTDSLGDTVREGDRLTFKVTYRNNTGEALTAFPAKSNISDLDVNTGHNCRWVDLPGNSFKECPFPYHVVTAEDAQRGKFVPRVEWKVTRDRNGEQVVQDGMVTELPAIKVVGGVAPDPLGTPRDYAIGESARLANAGAAGFQCHRIPALTKTPINGWLIAAWDGRPFNCADAPQANSIIYRISKDGGKSWTPIKTALAGKTSPGNQKYGYSDPSFVVDRETNKIFLFSVKSFNQGIAGSHLGTDPNDRNVIHASVAESDDDGLTWKNVRTITKAITNDPSTWRFRFAASGEGIQLKYGEHKGRLIQQYTTAINDKGWHANSVYSDDHGVTWKSGEPTPQQGADENKVVELSDGRLMVNTRTRSANGPGGNHRMFATSDDQGQTWSNWQVAWDLVDPVNNASIIRAFPDAPKDSMRAKILLFSNAYGSTRQNGYVRVSYDNGMNWNEGRQFKDGAMQYSTLTPLGDGKYGLLYEGESSTINYMTIDQNWLHLKDPGAEAMDPAPALRAAVDKVAQLEEELAAKEATLASLQADKAALEKAKQDLEGQKAELEKAKGDLEATQAQLTKEKSALEAERDSLQKSHDALNQDKVELTETVETLEGEKQVLQEQKSALESKQEALQAKIVALESDGKDHTEQIKQLKSDLADVENTLADTRQQLADTASELATTKDALGETEAKLAKTSEELSGTKADLANKDAKLAETAGELAKTKGELDTTRDKLVKTAEDLEKTQTALTKKTEELHETNGDLSKSEAELAAKTEELKKTQTELEQTKSELEKSLDEHQNAAELAKTKAELARVNGELGKVNAELAKVKELEAKKVAREEFDRLKDELAKTNAELEKVRESEGKKVAKEKVDQLDQELAKTKAELEKVRESEAKKVAKEKVDQLNQELAKLKVELEKAKKKEGAKTAEDLMRQINQRVAKAPKAIADPFKDVKVNSPFANEIYWLAKSPEQVSTGYADGTFRPKLPVTREAMAAFLYRLAGSPKVTAKKQFKDVPANYQFAKEITWLSQTGITTGWADGTFRPRQPIERHAMAAFMNRACVKTNLCSPALKNLKVDPLLPKFKDMGEGKLFDREVQWMQQAGITTGWADGTFRPENSVTREAMAAFLYRLRFNR